MKTAKVGIHMTMRYGSSGARDGAFAPVVRNTDSRNSTFDRLTKQSVFIEGDSDTARITDVTISDCSFGGAPAAGMVTNASRVKQVGTRGSGLA